MKSLIVYSHQNPKSFNHAILEIYKDLLEKQGNEVKVRDLYSLGFNPTLGADDFISFQKGITPPAPPILPSQKATIG